MKHSTTRYQPTSWAVRVIFLIFLIAGLLSACGDSNENTEKDDTGNVTIGIVNLTSALDPVVDGFKAGMAERGYTEGDNVTYLYEGPVGNIEGLDAAVQKLVDADVDMIFSLSTPATIAAKRVTAETNIPVVFGTVTNPIVVGLVDSLTQHEGNVTGVRTGGSEPKTLEWLHTVVPNLQRVYIPYNPNDASSSSALQEVIETAGPMGVDIVSVETPTPDAVLTALQTVPEDIDGILLLPDSIVVAQIADIVAFALEQKIPLAGINKEHVEAGALLAYGTDHLTVGKQAARLAQQVLKGTSPADLPIETAEFYLAINLQTASTIGITIDDTTLRQAATIIR